MIRFKSTHFTRNAFENGFPIGYPWLNFPMYMYMSYIYHFFKHWLNKKCFRNIHAPPPWCKIQNYYLCTRHYEFGTSHKAKLNINYITVNDLIIMITHWAKNSG